MLFIRGVALVALCFLFSNATKADTKCCPKYKVVTKTVEKIVYVDKPVFVEKPVIVEKEVIKRVDRSKKNNISLLVGKGPTNIGLNGNRVDLYSDLVGGVSYTRSLGALSMGGVVQTNRTVLGSVGFNF